MQFALTLIGAPLPEGIEQSAADILGAIGLGVEEAKALSPGRACDLFIGGTPDIAHPQIMAMLREGLPEIDLAFQPAMHRRKQVLCADMDSTIVVGETIDELADALGLKEKVAAITARAMAGELDFEAALDERVAMLKGLAAATLDDIAANLTYADGAEALVKTMAANDARCVLVSGGFDAVTGAVRERLGFHRDVANHLEVGGDNCLLGTARRPIVDSGTKLSVLDETVQGLCLTRDGALTIGDGANDRPMIEAAGLGIAWQGKPTLKEATPFHIDHTDLRSALYIQGYSDEEIVDA